MSAATPPGLAALFTGFLCIALSGFGGTLAWSRRLIVEERRWLTGVEFTEALGVCQLLPGPNVVNIAIFVGARFHGVSGALAAFVGLVAVPFVVVVALATVYGGVAQHPTVRGAFGGLASVVAGLILATGVKMTAPLRADVRMLALCAVAFVAAAFVRVPVLWIVLGLGPLGIALAWRRP